jgi:protein AbiQ
LKKVVRTTVLTTFYLGEKMDKLKFYLVDQDYLNFLKRIDSKVPDVNQNGNSKFYCGVVLEINGYHYFAPISSFTQQQQTNIVITHKNIALSSIRFCFMVPVPPYLLTEMDFTTLESKYRGLVIKEYDFCTDNEADIRAKAQKIYSLAQYRSSFVGNQCCDFRQLEQAMNQYMAARSTPVTSEETLKETAADKQPKDK